MCTSKFPSLEGARDWNRRTAVDSGRCRAPVEFGWQLLEITFLNPNSVADALNCASAQ